MSDIRAFVAQAVLALREHASAYRVVTGRGGCKDWADYQHRVGRAAGLEDAAQALEDYYQAQVHD